MELAANENENMFSTNMSMTESYTSDFKNGSLLLRTTQQKFAQNQLPVSIEMPKPKSKVNKNRKKSKTHKRNVHSMTNLKANVKSATKMPDLKTHRNARNTSEGLKIDTKNPDHHSTLLMNQNNKLGKLSLKAFGKTKPVVK